MTDTSPISADEMETCLHVLQTIADSRGSIRRSDKFNALIAKVYRQSKKFDLRAERQKQWAEDRAAQAQTAMVKIQRDALSASTLSLPPVDKVTVLNRPETCYICKEEFSEVHFFYHLLCPKCAEVNFTMRHLSADLRGRTALVTGGRVKIGYQMVLRLLRDGAKVILTTRFPNAAARRFFAEADSAAWQGRLQIYGLDLRNLPSVEQFAQHLLHTEPAIDIVIHNAAQTIARPPGFYTELLAGEEPGTIGIEAGRLVAQEAPPTTVIDSVSLLPASVPSAADILPANKWEDNEELADSRTTNSWLLRLDEVSGPEMLEVQLVNSVAPFLLNSRLKPLLVRSPFERRFIVNVSAMEGQFSRHKTVYHPHTNMAKAALNMMTRTSGADYARDRIYMNSVDTGWVTDENPTAKREKIQTERGFFAPLDIVDGMARIYHPIAQGINNAEEPFAGRFLKDYAPCPW